ncbi:UvrD-helicase domain-containing protein [Streptomyces sp. M10(2022)]
MRIGLEPTTRLLADATRYQLAARVLREAPALPALTRSFPTLVSDLLALDAELAEHLVEPERLAEYDTDLLRTLDSVKLTNAELRKIPEAAEARRELLGLTRRYRAAKRSRDLLDFGDQIALSAELALTRPEVGTILREEFRVVLLDEYQDTSVAQRRLLASLFGGAGEGRTGHPSPRSATPARRSTAGAAHPSPTSTTSPALPHADGTPPPATPSARTAAAVAVSSTSPTTSPPAARHARRRRRAAAGPGAERDGIVRCALLRTHSEEIDWLADSLAHLVRTGKAPVRWPSCAAPPGTSPDPGGARRPRHPGRGRGPVRAAAPPEVADLVAVCEVLQDPGANACLVRLLTGPRWRIGPGTSPCSAAGPVSWSTVPPTRMTRTSTRTAVSPKPSRASTPPR